MAEDSSESIQRWTEKRRVALVVQLVKGELSAAEAARMRGLTALAGHSVNRR